jgi:hypothetical protein
MGQLEHDGRIAVIWARLRSPRTNTCVSTQRPCVHRVWKGSVYTEIRVYFVPNVDRPSFTQGGRQVVFAGRQSEEMRRFSAPASPRREAWVQPCSSDPRWDDEKALKELGPWHTPSLPRADELASDGTSEFPSTIGAPPGCETWNAHLEGIRPQRDQIPMVTVEGIVRVA